MPTIAIARAQRAISLIVGMTRFYRIHRDSDSDSVGGQAAIRISARFQQ